MAHKVDPNVAPDTWDFAEAWRPEVGDVVEGKISSLSVGHSDYGQHPIIELTKEDGTRVAIHAFHTTLRNKLAEVKPKVGNTLAVKYFGEVEPKSGKGPSYHKYLVKSDAVTEFNWDAMSTDLPQPVAAEVAEDDIPF